MNRKYALWRETACRAAMEVAYFGDYHIITFKFGVIHLRFKVYPDQARRMCVALLSDKAEGFITQAWLRPFSTREGKGVDQDSVGAEEI